MAGQEKDHFVYRFYDAEDSLLYVGITRSLDHRIQQHFRHQVWANEIEYTVVEHGYSGCAARNREMDLIHNASPRHNVTTGKSVDAVVREFKETPPGCYLTIDEIAKRWLCKRSRVYEAVKKNQVSGARRDEFGNWRIPENTELPDTITRGLTLAQHRSLILSIKEAKQTCEESEYRAATVRLTLDYDVSLRDIYDLF